jgi:acyl-CoA thioesterase I
MTGPSERSARAVSNASPVTIDLDGPRTPLIDAARYRGLRNLPFLAALDDRGDLDERMMARLLDCDLGSLHQIRSELRTALGRACDELLADSTFTQAVLALPFRPGEVVVAVGDSITADQLSWAEILGCVFARLRPEEVRFVNASVSGVTTADLIARLHDIAAHEPSWVIAMIGTNDARRHGSGGPVRMASAGETARNLAALGPLLRERTASRLVLVTPPPVDEERLLAYEAFREVRVTWRSEEIDQVAELVRGQTDVLVIDVHRELVSEEAAGYLTADGIHPSIAGQMRIARAIATALAGAFELLD